MNAKTLVLVGFGAASVGFLVAAQPTSALACDVSSPTDISCPGANSNPANPLYFVTHPPPPAAVPAPGLDPSAGEQETTVFNPGGLLSGFYANAGLCQLGDDVCPAPVSAEPPPPYRVLPRHHRKHHRAE